MDYLKNNCDGKLFAVGGVSLGAQIAIELLSLDSDITQKAIIDSSICIPQPKLARACTVIVKIFEKPIFNKPTNKIQIGRAHV